jgi:hypothetical protein
LVDPATGVLVGGSASVGEVTVSAAERVFEWPEPEVSADVQFGEALRLIGHDVKREAGADALRVTLHWQARARMGVAYKFFVHLLDARTGELVAQADVMPRDWTYPTTWWEEDEVISDDIVLDVSGISPGEYRVVAGVYDPDTGIRLPVADSAQPGEASPGEAGQYPLVEGLVLP